MGRKAVLSGLLAVACLAGIGCGGNSNPIPVINSVSPASVPAGEGAFVFSISGTNMNNSSAVTFGSNTLTVLNVQTPPCPSQMNCPVVLVVLVPASQVSAAGSQQVSVATAGRRSKSVTFNVTSPQILTMSPSAVPAGAAAFPLTLTVVGAAPTIQVGFGTAKNPNTPLTPTGPISCNPQTACTVVVTVPAASVQNAGTMQVTATNPLASNGGTATANFLVTTPGTGFPLAQSASGGTLGNAPSTHSSVSDGGLFVAFDSTAANLTSTPTGGLSQVYLTQNCFGMASCTPQTTMISTAGGAAGAGGVFGSVTPAISPDGRFVVFASDDTNLVPAAAQPILQIYLYDSCNSISGAVKGCTPGVTLISSNGMAPGNGPSQTPVISSSGLYIAYESTATNLTSATVPAGVNQIYLYQNCTGQAGPISGCSTATTLLSTDVNGDPGDAPGSFLPSIDPAGLAVAFQSLSDNIVPGVPTNGNAQIYVRTTCLEASPILQSGCPVQTVLASADSSNGPGNGPSVTPSLTDNGNLFVAFASAAPNLLPATTTVQQIFGVQACVTLPTTVGCAPGARVLSVNASGTPGQAASSNPSASGTKVVFTSLATLLSGVTGQQVFGVPACAPGPCSATPVLISVDTNGNAIGGDFGAVGGGGLVTFSTMGSSGAPGIGEIFLAAPF